MFLCVSLWIGFVVVVLSLLQDTVRVDEEPYVARKEVNTALAEPKSLSKNVTGPPVYYPPGKELFSKSEAQARWRAQV